MSSLKACYEDSEVASLIQYIGTHKAAITSSYLSSHLRHLSLQMFKNAISERLNMNTLVYLTDN